MSAHWILDLKLSKFLLYVQRWWVFLQQWLSVAHVALLALCFPKNRYQSGESFPVDHRGPELVLGEGNDLLED
jgi:hypothetical protein